MRAKTNAAMLASPTTPTAVTSMTMVLFRSCRQKASLVDTST